MKPLRFIGLFIIMVCQGACTTNIIEPSNTPLEETLATATGVPTKTPSPVVEDTPTETVSPTATIEPTYTPTTPSSATPTLTFTPTPTALSWSDTVIGPENAAQVESLKVWGKGIVEEIHVLDAGNKLILRTPLGVYVYSKNNLADLAFYESAKAYTVSPDTRFFAAAYEGGILEIRSAAELELLHTFVHEAEAPRYPPADFNLNDYLAVTAMSFSDDGSKFAAAFGNNQIKLYSMSSGELLYIYESNFTPIPARLLFSPDGKFLISDDQRIVRGATRTYINTLAIWSAENGELISTIPEAGFLGDFPINPDSSLIAAGKPGGFVLLYSLPEGKLTMDFGTGTGLPTVDFSRDGQYMYINGGYQIRRIEDGKEVTLDDKGKLKQWPNLAGLSDEQERMLGHHYGLQAIKITGDEEVAVWGSNRNTLYRWDVEQQEIQSFELDDKVRWVHGLAISNDEELVALCSDIRARYETLYILATNNGATKNWGDCEGLISLSPDGDFLAVSNRSLIDILSVEDGTLIRNMRGHTGDPGIVTFSADGQYLMSSNTGGRGGGELIVWKMDPASKYRVLTGATSRLNSIKMSPDNGLLASAGERVRIWRLEDGWQLHILAIEAESLAFSPDGSILAVGDSEGVIYLIDVSTGDELGQLQGHHDEVVGLMFGPGGTNIVSISLDGTTRLWGIRPPD